MRVGFLAVALAALVGCGESAGTPTLALDPGLEADARIVVSGLGAATLRRLRPLEPQDEAWQEHLVVQFSGPASSRLPNLAGDYSVAGDRVLFAPAFPFLTGRSYRAAWKDPTNGEREPVELVFTIPQPPLPHAEVRAIYPSADALPENLLRFYIHFSQPMSEGHAERALRLLRDDGTVVIGAFAVPERELWNRGRDRLTVLLDPGRVKRDVGPNLALGAPLTAGNSYRLVVGKEWLDARGRPLGRDFDKRFQAVPAERRRLDSEGWHLSPPTRGESSLVLAFPRSLDHALLIRTLHVRNDRGERVDGSVTLGAAERSWTFTPTAPWRAGRYAIRVDDQLEDPAGNSLRGPFETTQGNRAGTGEASRGRLDLPFEVH